MLQALLPGRCTSIASKVWTSYVAIVAVEEDFVVERYCSISRRSICLPHAIAQSMRRFGLILISESYSLPVPRACAL